MSATGARTAAAARLAQAMRDRLLARRMPRSRQVAALGRPRPRTLLAAVAAVVLLLAGWFWLRDSSLVAVRTVEVTGIGGAQGARVRAALEEAARSMTTLHVRQDALDTAAEPFSIVKRVETSTDFPHTMRIHVVTNVAVGAIVVDGRRTAVTSDGTILRDATAPARLPEIPVRSTPGGRASHRARSRRGGCGARRGAIGAAGRVEAVRTTPENGLELQLAHGPLLVFGDGRAAGGEVGGGRRGAGGSRGGRRERHRRARRRSGRPSAACPAEPRRRGSPTSRSCPRAPPRLTLQLRSRLTPRRPQLSTRSRDFWVLQRPLRHASGVDSPPNKAITCHTLARLQSGESLDANSRVGR